MIIITDDLRNNLEYDGKTRKFGVTIDNKNYLIKFAKNNTYSVYSEYVASNFMNTIGVTAHNVSIGIYNNTGELINIIEDFNNERQVDYKNTKNDADNVIKYLAFIYDLNYIYSFKYIKEKHIIDTIYKTIKDKEKFKYYFDKINKYIDNRIKENDKNVR